MYNLSSWSIQWKPAFELPGLIIIISVSIVDTIFYGFYFLYYHDIVETTDYYYAL